jgi:glutathione S-transferase
MAPNGKPYYRVTDAPDTKVDALALREIGKQLLQEDSPYILGKDFTAVEVALAPFWQRIHYYRPQLDFVATEDPALARCDRLVASYGDYARNEATSDFAQTMQTIVKK